MSLLNLLPASWRGVPFAVTDHVTTVTRRQAVHEYPDREDVWTEDMGRGATRYRVRGFIVAHDPVYSGGPIDLQRLALLTAAKAKGPGVLIHPTLGILTVNCDAISLGEALDGATYSTIELSFVESGRRSFPSLSLDGLTVSSTVITAAAGAAQAVRLLSLGGTGSAGSATGALPSVTGQWSDQVAAAGADATALSRLATALPGNLGRYSRGATAGYLSSITAGPSTIDQLVALASRQRATIAAAAESLNDTVAGLTVGATEADYAIAVATLLAALAAACADPADALRLLTQLLAYTPVSVDAATAPGRAVTALFKLSVTIELTRAAAAYQPSSYEDAFARLVEVTAAIDVAIDAAGNAAQDGLYTALRTLRAAVVEDLRTRGASLAHVRTFTVAAPLPALALAQRLYRNAGRADELVGEAGDACVSPLFMPTNIQALAA
ncbi:MULTISPECIES: DNA circularization N-terminal domain-containing protein [Sphingomonas]|uniref:DNA circularization N-terminal domain-containing protein n=1 Tax=Sphingomonas TaxID=13687 RepID=UPI00254F5D04|nr:MULTISPECIES: DNA circularization N-terminal domain-containing protein [Sphingomonas]MDK8187781.1 DNA circularization N-terminal domain-containing protein [Sphingomonas zeae]MDK8217635.1 DNA circularization N-terminal domain-containing protein [Sphingomonas sp. UMB7805-LC452B]